MIAKPARTPEQAEREEYLLNTTFVVKHTVLSNGRVYYHIDDTWVTQRGDGTWGNPYQLLEVSEKTSQEFNALVGITS